MRTKLTPGFVANPPIPSADRTVYWDESPTGFGLVVTASGHKSFVLQYRLHGKSWRMTFKDGLTLDKARKEAKKYIGDVARGINPLEEKRRKDKETKKQAAIEANTLQAVAEQFFTDSDGGANLRSIGKQIAMFKRNIFPDLGTRPIVEITRTEIRALVNKIRRNSGGRSAHRVLSYISTLMNWYARNNDDFHSPIVKGMSNFFKPSEHARERVLTDDEIRVLWRATESTDEGAEGRAPVYGSYVRFVLLTATRCNEAARMRWDEVSNGDWLIPAERMKGKKGHKRDHLVPLSAAARAIIDGLPTLSPFVFTYDGHKPISSFSRSQKVLKAKSGTSGWTIHDLRRTARSLMSRAGINADHAERCLAHIIGGVRGVYDRHAYRDEKARAFEALAAQVERIVNPPADNIVPLRTKEISQVPG
jgi:integrase